MMQFEKIEVTFWYIQIYGEFYGELGMNVSYKKLWKLLIDKNMIKKQLREQAGLTTNVIAKLGKDENVSTEVLCKICKALNCGLEDIIEIIPDEKEEQSNDERDI